MITKSERRLVAAKAQNLLREYNDFLLQVKRETDIELDTPINGITSDEIALQYMRKQGGKEALNNFFARLNSKANDRD